MVRLDTEGSSKLPVIWSRHDIRHLLAAVLDLRAHARLKTYGTE
jgi:hypothetical protein